MAFLLIHDLQIHKKNNLCLSKQFNSIISGPDAKGLIYTFIELIMIMQTKIETYITYKIAALGLELIK